MKISRTFTLSVLLSGGMAFQAHCQSVTLGAANFDESSSNAPAEGFGAMTMEVVQTLSGYGDYAGFLKTRKCSVSEATAGVNCLKCTTDGASEIPEVVDLEISATGSRVGTTESRWLAFDTAGNLRVLKTALGGAVSYQASATETPPILIPASPAVAQTWSVLGNKMTVVALDASAGGHESLLKIKVEAEADDAGAPAATEDTEFEFRFYKAGVGLVMISSSASDTATGSGWSLATE
jgi:hypothetical protein